ncbi:MAG TPA: DNA replication/repair protein RecF [Actinomycetes bacterium]|nr:DNA replication/repair protein RecF [Actinomycetes bacterium]
MHLATLSLVEFRSYEIADVALDAGVTVFAGPNGQGKTNLIEAIGYLASQTSHRVAIDAPLVRSGAPRAVIRGEIVRDGRTLLVELEINPGKANRARLNRATLPRAREALGALRTVLFAPEDIALVKGDPSDRRRYLDDLLVARAPRFAGVRHDYERILKQRNALLKTAATARRGGRSVADLRTLDVWDGHLARTGAELLAARLELVESIRPLVDKTYESVAPGGGPAVLEYRSSLPAESAALTDRALLEAALVAAMAAARADEIERGVSLHGPHRDDLLLKLGSLPARGYASHGEAWALALALRLAAYELLRSDGGEPVLILDDVFAELDTDRRGRLAELVGRAEQVLITAAVPADIPERLQGARFDVMAGMVTRVR